MKKFIKLSAPLWVLLLGFVIIKGLAIAKPEPEQKEQETRLVSLYTDEVQAESVTVSVTTQGEVKPKTEIELVPQVSGRIIMMSESFNDGAEFSAGTVLMQIDPTDYELAAIRAEAQVAQAQTELERQQATRKIKEEEWRDGRSKNEPTNFALNLTQVAQAEAMLLSAKADLRKARLDLERTSIAVPFEGRVRERKVGIGQYVTAGTSLGRVFSINTVEVRLPLTDQQLVELNVPLGFTASESKQAPKVNFSAKLGSRTYAWTGKIVRVSAAVDNETRLIYATAEVEDPYGKSADKGMPLAVGMFVNADILGSSEQDALVMPRMALRAENKVYVINKENRLEIRTVEVLSTSEDTVLVTAGVSRGEAVVTSPLPNAVEGMEVRAIPRIAQNS